VLDQSLKQLDVLVMSGGMQQEVVDVDDAIGVDVEAVVES
jgi:hypothetical protein